MTRFQMLRVAGCAAIALLICLNGDSEAFFFDDFNNGQENTDVVGNNGWVTIVEDDANRGSLRYRTSFFGTQIGIGGTVGLINPGTTGIARDISGDIVGDPETGTYEASMLVKPGANDIRLLVGDMESLMIANLLHDAESAAIGFNPGVMFGHVSSPDVPDGFAPGTNPPVPIFGHAEKVFTENNLTPSGFNIQENEWIEIKIAVDMTAQTARGFVRDVDDTTGAPFGPFEDLGLFVGNNDPTMDAIKDDSIYFDRLEAVGIIVSGSAFGGVENFTSGVIPEPTGVVLLTLGGLLIWRRRRWN